MYRYNRAEQSLILEMIDQGCSPQEISLKIRGSTQFTNSILYQIRKLIKQIPELFPFRLKDINGTFLTKMLEREGIKEYRITKHNRNGGLYYIYDRKTGQKIKDLCRECYLAVILVKGFINDYKTQGN